MKIKKVETPPQAEETAIWKSASFVATMFHQASDKSDEIRELVWQLEQRELNYSTEQEKRLCEKINRDLSKILRRVCDLSDSLLDIERTYCKVFDLQMRYRNKLTKAK